MFLDTGQHEQPNDLLGQIRQMLKTQADDLRALKEKLDALIKLEEQGKYQEKRIDKLEVNMSLVNSELEKWRTFRHVGGWILGGGGFITVVITALLVKYLNI